MSRRVFRAGKYSWIADAHLAEAATPEFWAEPGRWFAEGIQLFRPPSPKKPTVVGRREGFFTGRGPVILKRYRVVHRVDHLKNLFRPTRARRAFDLADELLKNGFLTAEPLAVGVRRASLKVQDAVLITSELANVVSMERFRYEDPYRTLQEDGLQNLAQTVAGLHGLRLLHTDPFTSNFFVENGTNRIILIDLDALHRRPVITRGLMARNLSKFFLRMAMTPQEQAWFIAQFLAVARTGWNSNDFLEEVRRHLEARKGKGR